MRTKIYYFTGTGNSLSIAKEVCNKIPQCELASIPKEYEKKNPISDCEKVGFVFPLHYAGLPKIVFDFVNKIDVSKSTYFFSVVTNAGDTTTWPFIQLEKILKEKSKKLDAGFCVTMPNNYILGYETHSEARQKTMFEEASKKSTQIAEDIKNNIDNLNLEIDEKRKSGSAKFNEQFRNEVNESDRSFYADENCNECGTCELVCPVNNIILIDGKPQWQHKCQQCLACINYCPEKAIQFGDKTLNFGRYHHPKITVQDLTEKY